MTAAPGRPVVVTGGTGFVGGAIVRHLVASGTEVRALSRSSAGDDALRALGAEPVRGDVGDPASLRAALDGAELAYHVAGVNAMCVDDPTRMLAVNVDGSAAVVHAAAAAGLRRLVHTSSAAVIGEPAGTVGREDSPHRGWFLSHYERSKFEAEAAVRVAAEETGLETVHVLPSSVQGPGRSGGTARIFRAYLDGRLRVVADTRFSVVDVDDCARGHLLAAERGEAGRRYLLSGATLRVAEAVELLRQMGGPDAPPRTLPPAAVRVGGALAEAAARVTGRDLGFCREMARTLLHGHAYDGSRATRELGLRYTPVEESLRRTVAWFRAEGLIST